MKKSIILVCGIGMIMAAAGCTAGQRGQETAGQVNSEQQTSVEKSEEQGASDKEGSSRKLTLGRWGNESQLAGFEQSIQGWVDEKYPGTKMEYSYCDGNEYPTKLQVWFSSGTSPDVIRNTTDIMYPFKNKGMFYDITEFVENDPEVSLDMWPEGIINLWKTEEGLIGLPVCQVSYCIVYNKDIFDKAGLPYPEDDWTEAEFLELCEKLTSGEGVDKTYGVWLGGWVTEYMRSLYGEPLLYDTDNLKMQAEGNEKFRDAMEMFASLYKNGYTSNEINQTQTSGGFVTGQYAMAVMQVTGTMNDLQTSIGDRFDWDIVQLPYSETYQTTWNSNVRINGYSISSQCKNPEMAYELVKYLATNESALGAEASAGVPVLNSFVESEGYLNDYYGYDANGVQFNKMAPLVMEQFVQPYEFAGFWSEINDNIKVVFDSYVNGVYSLDQAIEELQNTGENAINNYKVENGL